MPTQPPPERQQPAKARRHLRGPGWPDSRGWVALGLFGLAWRALEMLHENPALLANASFMQVVTLIIGSGGLLLVVAFFFAASKGAADANDRADDANKRFDAATKEPEQ